MKPAVRPAVTGWYWCRREGMAAPECVFFREPIPRLGAGARLFTIAFGDEQGIDFTGSYYDQDSTKWFGPMLPPPANGFW